MVAVIFRAQTNELDDRYFEMAKRMRELAISRYGCLEFIAVTEGRQEIAISYWNDLEAIERWKADEEHRKAQELGRNYWYRSYTVQVVEVLREYGMGFGGGESAEFER